MQIKLADLWEHDGTPLLRADDQDFDCLINSSCKCIVRISRSEPVWDAPDDLSASVLVVSLQLPPPSGNQALHMMLLVFDEIYMYIYMLVLLADSGGVVLWFHGVWLCLYINRRGRGNFFFLRWRKWRRRVGSTTGSWIASACWLFMSALQSAVKAQISTICCKSANFKFSGKLGAGRLGSF